MACHICKDDPTSKLYCSAVHPELLPVGWYYKEGYLYNEKNERVKP